MRKKVKAAAKVARKAKEEEQVKLVAAKDEKIMKLEDKVAQLQIELQKHKQAVATKFQ